MSYQFVSSPPDKQEAASAYLHNTPNDYILMSDVQDGLDDTLSEIDHIFTDADGTVVHEGYTEFEPEKIDLFRCLGKKGIGVTVVTGKPLEEVEKLHASIPDDVPIIFICEKGAYEVFWEDGKSRREFILSSRELESAVDELKHAFERESPKIIDILRTPDGKQTIWFGWSGSGQHKSILSIDIYDQEPPANYLDMAGAERDKLKLKDPELLGRVEQLLENFVRRRYDDWRVIHLGNGNTDIAPGQIEKDEAIQKTNEFQQARRVLLLGDTENDRAMFNLRDTYPEKALAGLVLHREKGLPLVDSVDFVTFGMANTDPLLDAVISSRE